MVGRRREEGFQFDFFMFLMCGTALALHFLHARMVFGASRLVTLGTWVWLVSSYSFDFFGEGWVGKRRKWKGKELGGSEGRGEMEGKGKDRMGENMMMQYLIEILFPCIVKIYVCML
jgi:hypothetical protein